MSACPRCGSATAVIDPHGADEHPYDDAHVRYATVECGCFERPFEVRHDPRRHEPGECQVLGDAAIETDEDLAVAIAAASHPDEVVVGWGVEP